MKAAKNWASRPHSPPGSSEATNIHKATAMNVNPPKSERKTVPPGLPGPGTGKVHTPGWFSTRK